MKTAVLTTRQTLVDFNKILHRDAEQNCYFLKPLFKEWLAENHIHINSIRAKIHIGDNDIFYLGDSIWVERYNYLYEITPALSYESLKTIPVQIEL